MLSIILYFANSKEIKGEFFVLQMKWIKIYLLFLIFVFCFYPGDAGAIGINSFRPPNGYLVSRSETGASARFMTDKGMTTLEGRHSFFSYRTNQNKPYEARRILEHYVRLLENAGGEVVWAENVSIGGKSFTGKVSSGGNETWISVEVKDLRNYNVSLLERSVAYIPSPHSAQNTQEMMDEAEALILLETVDKTRQLQLDVSFRAGSSALTSVPPQFGRIAVMMRMDQSYNFRVEAPIDFPPRGTSEERRLLARARQRAIYDALIAAGTPASRLTMEYLPGETPEEISRARIVLR